MELIKTIITALFVTAVTENVIFSRGLGASTLVIISRDKRNIAGFSLCISYMSVFTSVLTWAIEKNFSDDIHYRYYKAIFYASILCMVYFVSLMLGWTFMKKRSSTIKRYLNFSAFNCAVMGIMLMSSGVCEKLSDYVLYGLGSGLGYSAALYYLSAVYKRLYSDKVPAAFRGFPLMMIYIGILSMALFGLTGYQMPF